MLWLRVVLKKKGGKTHRGILQFFILIVVHLVPVIIRCHLQYQVKEYIAIIQAVVLVVPRMERQDDGKSQKCDSKQCDVTE